MVGGRVARGSKQTAPAALEIKKWGRDHKRWRRSKGL